MNHKRGKPKSRRAGCLLCKGHKHQREKDSAEAQTLQERRQRAAEKVDQRQADTESPFAEPWDVMQPRKEPGVRTNQRTFEQVWARSGMSPATLSAARRLWDEAETAGRWAGLLEGARLLRYAALRAGPVLASKYRRRALDLEKLAAL